MLDFITGTSDSNKASLRDVYLMDVSHFLFKHAMQLCSFLLYIHLLLVYNLGSFDPGIRISVLS